LRQQAPFSIGTEDSEIIGYPTDAVEKMSSFLINKNHRLFKIKEIFFDNIGRVSCNFRLAYILSLYRVLKQIYIYISLFISGPPPQQNCSINGTVYTSDKQIIKSLPFHVAINPPQPLPPGSSYAIVDTDSHVIELNLANIGSIPADVFCLSQLKVLSLQDTTDLSIPPEIIRLAPSLISFNMLSNSKSVVLPSELFEMSLLSTLSIVNCGLETLSEDIVKLSRLTQLTLDQNQLITLPPTLSKMPSLTNLSVNNNPRLSTLDALTGSTSLTTLHGSNCMINHLPTNISNLHTIELTGNQLTFLDGIETITSMSCNLLSFGNNKITSIPTNSLKGIQTLLYFDLSGNQLTTLPDSLYQINNLETLDIRNNIFDEKEKEWIEGIFRVTNTTVIM
jgi:leucine-rich repeat protein SHOC2